MKGALRKFFAISCALIFICTMPLAAFAHSGRTDSSGGHRDNKNKSGLGSYHYHCGGYPAHLHTKGHCPYRETFPSQVLVSAEKKAIGINETISVSAVVSPSNACDSSVSWESSDKNVVTVKNGTVTAVGYGTAKITATTFNGKSNSVSITVKEIVAESVMIQLLSAEVENICIGDKVQLKASIYPENVDNNSLTWSTSNPAVATVSENGSLRANSCGTVVISATASNGVSDNFEIDIKEVIAEIIHIEAPATIEVGDTTALSVKFYPINTTDQNVEWTSDNEDVISITSDGKIVAHQAGIATICAKQKDVDDFCKIEVRRIPVDKISISSSLGKRIKVGEITDFLIDISPPDATFSNITWSVDNPEIAVISEKGKLEAISKGTVTVTAMSADEVSDTYTITIKGKSNMPVAPIAVIAAGVWFFTKKKKN